MRLARNTRLMTFLKLTLSNQKLFLTMLVYCTSKPTSKTQFELVSTDLLHTNAEKAAKSYSFLIFNSILLLLGEDLLCLGFYQTLDIKFQ